MATQELYPGQSEIVAGKLREDEATQEADRERLKPITNSAERETILRRIAGREGSLSTRRRFLAQLSGGIDEGAKGKVIRLRLTDGEYGDLQQSAESAGQTLSQFIRSKIL